MQIAMFPRLERFDVEFDLPEAFLPEFPPAIFLQNRPDLGDVSRGEVISINNYYRLFKDILTPAQLDGLRRLLTPFPQEEFNPTDDRKSAQPSAPSSLDFGVESFQFHAGVFDTKLPIDAALFAVRLVRPGCNFSLQYGQFTDAAVAETLAR